MNRVASRSAGTRLLASLNGDGAYGVALLAAIAVLLLPELGGDVARTALRYDREAIAAGEFWRWITGQFVHLDLVHAVLNALGLVLMWALFARDFTPGRWAIIIAVSIATIDIGLWFLSPEVEWYVGASGWLHGVMVAGTVAHLRRGDLDGWILAAFIVAKLTVERLGIDMPFAGDDPVVPVAHLYGALGGLAAALVLPSRREPL
jgi:rhomboid family GlyGly-CTERM serine protease